MATQLGYGKFDTTGSPFDFLTDAALGGVTGKLATGLTWQMVNNKLIVDKATSALAALTVTLPQNAPDGATVEISTTVGSSAITALTVNAATSYNGTGSTVTAPIVVSDSVVGTAVSALAAATTIRYQYTLLGDNTAGAGARSWLRVA